MSVTVPDFSQARVLVVGDVMLDRYWHGATSRVSPEAPVPVVRINENEERLGGAGNVALNIASLGGQASLLALTGDDEAADSLENLLTNAGVQSKFVRDAKYPTITKLRVLSRNQQLIRLDFEDGFPGVDGSELIAPFAQSLAQHNVLILSDYGKGTLRNIESLIAQAREQELPVLVDPKGADFTRYRGATLVTPNMKEFEEVVGNCVDEQDIERKGQQLMQECDLQALLVTRGENGMSLLRMGQPALHLPTHAREVFDVTGAGDTVIGTLAAGLSSGLPLDSATRLANMAAGVVVGKLGTATTTPKELAQAMLDNKTIDQGVVSEDELMDAIEAARARGESIVLTNGCFDILHAGHVTYLEEAAQLGDRMIVAVNIDETVRALKGPERPVNPVENRMKVLAALGCVDWVVAFTEETPERLICRVAPDYLVKGGDNDPQNIPGNQCTWDQGGKVVVMSYVDGVSTTKIVESIKQK